MLPFPYFRPENNQGNILLCILSGTVKSGYVFDCYFYLLFVYEDVVIMYQRVKNLDDFSPLVVVINNLKTWLLFSLL